MVSFIEVSKYLCYMSVCVMSSCSFKVELSPSLENIVMYAKERESLVGFNHVLGVVTN